MKKMENRCKVHVTYEYFCTFNLSKGRTCKYYEVGEESNEGYDCKWNIVFDYCSHPKARKEAGEVGK